MTGRLATAVKARLEHVGKAAVAPRRIGALIAQDGPMLEVDSLAQPIGAGARIATPEGGWVRGEVVGFRGARSLILPFAENVPLMAGAPVYPDRAGGMVQCGPSLLGRVIDAHGDPLDGRGAIRGRPCWPLAGRKTNPLTHARVVTPFETGVRAINALLTMGEGQRVAIVAGSGVGKSILMSQILAGSDADVYVIGLIGERAREVADFVETKLPPAVRPRAVVVAVPANHPPHLRLRAANRATAIAEFFRHQGKRVLLLIDSLTRTAHAQREIGLALGEPPTMKGYPPSALGMIPRLIERAGIDRTTGGSITAIYTVLADGGDHDDPVVDTARAIVDGHIVLSRQLAEQGVFPAIDVPKSLSRTMADTVDERQQEAAARLRNLWSHFDENRDLVLMGAYGTGTDPLIDEAMARRAEILRFVSQAPTLSVDFSTSRTDLIGAFGGD
jgi:flagellum-specific ATP synthase